MTEILDRLSPVRSNPMARVKPRVGSGGALPPFPPLAGPSFSASLLRVKTIATRIR